VEDRSETVVSRLPAQSAGGPLARALLLAAVVPALLAGCGLISHSPSTGSLQADTGVVGYYIPATLAQLASGRTFGLTVNTLQKEAFQACIGRLGFDQQAQAVAFRMLNFMPFGGQNGWVQAQEAGLGLVNLATVSRSGMLVPIFASPLSSGRSKLPQAEMRALQVDQWHCWRQVRLLSAPLDREGFGLFQRWYSAETRVLESAPVQAADHTFSTCVLKQGAPRTAAGSLRQFVAWIEQVVNRGTGFQRFVGGIGGPAAFGGPVVVQVTPAPAPGGGFTGSGSVAVFSSGRPGPGQSSSSSAVARQHADARWSAVFVRCAGPLVAMLQAQLLIKQSAFMQAHFQQVAALEQRARTTMATLERMAWAT
jgi:hypothetical protein